MGQKVYLVVYDPQGDQRIVGVYSSRAAAKAALHLAGDASEVLEYPVDAPLPKTPEGRDLWHVYHGTKLNEYNIYRECAFETHEMDKVIYRHGGFDVTLWAQNKKNAKQLALAQIERYKQQHGLSK